MDKNFNIRFKDYINDMAMRAMDEERGTDFVLRESTLRHIRDFITSLNSRGRMRIVEIHCYWDFVDWCLPGRFGPELEHSAATTFAMIEKTCPRLEKIKIQATLGRRTTSTGDKGKKKDYAPNYEGMVGFRQLLELKQTARKRRDSMIVNMFVDICDKTKDVFDHFLEEGLEERM